MAAAVNTPPVLSLTNVNGSSAERHNASLATIQQINQCWMLPTSTSVPSGRNSCTSACVCWVGGWPILLTVASPCYTFHLLTHTEQGSSCSAIPTPTPSMHYPRAQTCLLVLICTVTPPGTTAVGTSAGTCNRDATGGLVSGSRQH